MRPVVLGLLNAVRFIFDVLAYAVAIGFVALLAFEFIHAPKLSDSSIMLRVGHYLNPLVRMVSGWFGWQWPRGDAVNWAPAILAIATMLVKSIVDGLLARVDFTARRLLKQKIVRHFEAPEDPAQEKRRYKLSAESEEERAVLLKRYREIEDALKGAEQKTCTFLSLDVVGSTAMKQGERDTSIAATFQAYEELVKRSFEEYGVWKQTWTPDGVMAAFLDLDLATAAGQKILGALKQFNTEENQLRTQFKVRGGLNQGSVSIFEDSALEKIADHSIDVAGHMQKHASEDGLQVAEFVYELLKAKDGFAATGGEVDGYKTYEWHPSRVTL
jgi:class 3 adenylate cyclase